MNRKLSDAPGTLPVTKAILETAKKNLDGIPPLLIDQNQTSIGATDLGFHQGMLELYYNLGDIKKSLEFAEKATQIAEIRVKVREGSNASRRNLALTYESFANVTQEGARDMVASGKLLAEALRIRKDVIENPKPDPEWKDEEAEAYHLFLDHELSDSHVKVASNFLKIGNIEKSASHFREAMNLRKRIMAAYAALSWRNKFQNRLSTRCNTSLNLPGLSGTWVIFTSIAMSSMRANPNTIVRLQ